jgi:uncharacterized membrane protein
MTSSPALLGAAAALTWGLADALLTTLARQAGNVPTLLAVHGASLIVLLAAAVASGRAVDLTQWLAVAALGPVASLTYLAFYRALMLGPITIVSPIASANGALVILLAVMVLASVCPDCRQRDAPSCSGRSWSQSAAAADKLKTRTSGGCVGHW